MANAKFKFYKVTRTGEVLPALRTPSGYEDAHPQDYEGCDGPARGPDASDVKNGTPLLATLPAVAAGAAPLYHSGGGQDACGPLTPIDLANAPVASLDAAGLPALDPYNKPQRHGPVTTIEGLKAMAERAPATEGQLQEARDQNNAAGVEPIDVTKIHNDAVKANANADASTADDNDDPGTVAELKEALDAKGIAYTSTDRKADLQAKLDAGH